MRRLLIVGAGGFGRETLDWLQELPTSARDWDHVAGFLDGNQKALDGIDCTHSVIATPEDYQPRANDRFICTVGASRRRLQICATLSDKGAIFTTIIQPGAVISSRAKIGVGCIIGAGASTSSNVIVGDHSYLLANVVVAHDCIIGRGCNVSPGAVLSGGCTLGDGVMIGINASLLPGARVGDHATVGAGSVVLRSVKSGATVMGVPAKQIGGFAP